MYPLPYSFWITTTLLLIPRSIIVADSPEAKPTMDDDVLKDFELVIDFLSGNIDGGKKLD